MDFIPEPLRFYGGLAIAVVSALTVLFNLVQGARSYRHSMYRPLEKLFWTTLWLYGVGTGLKVAQVGPEWVRWHLGDIGFPLFAAMVLSSSVARRFYWDKSMSPLERAERAVHFGGIWRRGVVMGLVVSFAYEAMAGTVIHVLKQRGLGDKELGVGGFDILDIIHYSIGALIGWTLWHVWLRRAQHWLRLEQRSAKVAVADGRVARREAKKLKRPQGKGQKPGQVARSKKRRRRA